MKIKKILIVSVLAVALVGCGKHEFKHIIIMPDVSGSIDRQSLEQAFKSIDGLASHLQRGDRLTIIPILGDAEADAPGKIMRVEVPENRQTYDTDLRDLRSKLNSSLKEMRANAIAHPGSKTDVLGSIALAAQEFAAHTKPAKRILIILSDFIEEDKTLNFRSDSRLRSITSAPRFVPELSADNELHHVVAYLGLLRSAEYAALDQPRRNAIRNIWLQYLKNAGARPQFVIDGPGLLNSMLD
jgi:hypothetical protein